MYVFEVSQHCSVCSFLAAFHLFQNYSKCSYTVYMQKWIVWDRLSNWTRPRRMHKHSSCSSGHRKVASKADVRSHNAWTMNKSCLLTAHNIQNTWLKSQSVQLQRYNEKAIWIQTCKGDVELPEHRISIVHVAIHKSAYFCLHLISLYHVFPFYWFSMGTSEQCSELFKVRYNHQGWKRVHGILYLKFHSFSWSS